MRRSEYRDHRTSHDDQATKAVYWQLSLSMAFLELVQGSFTTLSLSERMLLRFRAI